VSEEGFDYPRLLADATLGLVRDLLEQVEEEGLPGEHHFYLTFRTREEGVEMPSSLRVRFPETMTIVLQHQFERLEGDEQGFAVDLRFGGSWERLRIPFAALASFLDPSVPFGLDFTQFAVAMARDAADELVAENLEESEPEAVDLEDEGDAASPVPRIGPTSADVLPFRRRPSEDS